MGLRATFLLGICDEPAFNSGDFCHTGLYMLHVWVGVEDQLEPEFVIRQVRGIGPGLPGGRWDTLEGAGQGCFLLLWLQAGMGAWVSYCPLFDRLTLYPD